MIEEKASLSGVQPWQINIMIALLVLLIAVSGVQLWMSYQSETKWEYRIESVPDASFVRDVNTLGADGWELVFARRATNDASGDNPKPTFNYEMIFRRSVKMDKTALLIK